MISYLLLGFISSSLALSLLDLHDGQIPFRTYSKDNVQNNDDGTISFKEYADDYDNSLEANGAQKGPQRQDIVGNGQGGRSKSIPLIEAPVAMSNPIWKIFSRASDIYRIFRRSGSNSNPNSNYEESSNNKINGFNTDAASIKPSQPISSPFSVVNNNYPYTKKVTRNPRGWQLFL